ncbi:MAG TPA: hypothetical protein VJT74_07840 [Pyrinomonadaceae bacterium]|nr:hypothetical protein [Pyrinomonadaceae bacterium]
MKKAKLFTGAGLLVALVAGSAAAQRPRTIDPAQPSGGTATASNTAPKPAPAPQTFKAKYEGGIFAYNKKQTGTLTFDDANSRLVFRDKENKEYLSLPYSALTGAYADTKSRRPTAARVIGAIPAPYGANLPALFIRKKYRYLTLQFKDADNGAAGLTSFKVETKELLNSVLYTLAEKAGLEQRGDGYVRRSQPRPSDQNP